MDEKIKIGVIGAGNMGRNHIRILTEERNKFCFTGFYDSDDNRAKDIEGQFNIQRANSPEDIILKSDAVVIAVPSSLHKTLGLMAAEHKVHALIEKPLALNTEDSRLLCDAFDKSGKKLMVGHVERYNPALTELEKVLKNEKMIAIEARRYSPFDKRIYDADVVMDMMIHDIDIVCNLLENVQISKLYAAGSAVQSGMLDYTQSLIHFSNDVIANITASRITGSKVRELVIHGDKSYIYCNMLTRGLCISKITNYTMGVGSEASYRQESIMENVFVPIVEPLRAELFHFRECIVNDLCPKTDGLSALKAVQVAQDIRNLADSANTGIDTGNSEKRKISV